MFTFYNGHFSILKKSLFFLIPYPLYIGISSHQHQPTAIELTCAPSDLQAIPDKFGSRAQTIIDTALALDAYLRWYYPYKKAVPFMCDLKLREERALDNMCIVVDMMEIFERVSIRSHGSFLIHGAVYKCTRDILTLGNPWAVDLSPLELQNAESRRRSGRPQQAARSIWSWARLQWCGRRR